MPTISVDKAQLFKALGREYVDVKLKIPVNRHINTILDTLRKSLMSYASSLVQLLYVTRLAGFYD
jgi:hypothetical protein